EIPIQDTPDDYRDLYVDCWNNEPQNRPVIDAIVERLTLINKNQTLKNDDKHTNNESSELSETIQNDNHLGSK
ncbi:27875_t:CDS:2, partial [Racocetra persica]